MQPLLAKDWWFTYRGSPLCMLCLICARRGATLLSFSPFPHAPGTTSMRRAVGMKWQGEADKLSPKPRSREAMSRLLPSRDRAGVTHYRNTAPPSRTNVTVFLIGEERPKRDGDKVHLVAVDL